MEHDTFTIDGDAAHEVWLRTSPLAWGAMLSICSFTYVRCESVPAFDNPVAAGLVGMSAEQWEFARAELLAAGHIVQSSGVLVPAVPWARPGLDS